LITAFTKIDEIADVGGIKCKYILYDLIFYDSVKFPGAEQLHRFDIIVLTVRICTSDIEEGTFIVQTHPETDFILINKGFRTIFTIGNSIVI